MQRSWLTALLLSTIGIFVISSNTNAASNNSLTVAIDGLRNRKGQICLSLFSNDQGFPNKSDRALQIQCVKAEDTPLEVTFKNLTAGRYAVAVIHDANEDGKLNSGFLGIPKEGFGFSRNPKIRTGAPDFEDTAILLADQSTSIQILLKYLL